MRILQVIPVFSEFFGGPVFDVRSISKRLAEKHEVTIYTSTACDWNNDSEPREEWVDGYHVVYLPRVFKWGLLRELDICSGMNKLLKENLANFDIIHLRAWRQFMEVVTQNYANLYGIPYIHQAHGCLSRAQKKGRKLLYDVMFGYKILRDASSVIALSEVEANEYKMMGASENKINVIPNGIELSECEDLPPEGTFKKKYGIEDGRKIVLYLGRIHRTKGIDFLIKAYAYLLKDPMYENASLVVAGPDDGYLQEAKQLAVSLGITEKVLFPGILLGREKIAAFVDASICAYLRHNEPFGRVSLEAAAAGTPVVVCKDTPMSNIVSDGKFGFSVKYGDVTELVNVFKTIISDEELRKKTGKRGREYVFKNFGWDNITLELERLYEQVINCP